MLFGDKEKFALECEIDAEIGAHLYGYFRFWINGYSAGDFDEVLDLRESSRFGRDILKASVRRPWVDTTTPADVLLYEFYERYVGFSAIRAPSPWDRDAFLLDEMGRGSTRDKFIVIALRSKNGERVICREYARNIIKETTVPPRVCDFLVREYCDWVDHFATI